MFNLYMTICLAHRIDSIEFDFFSPQSRPRLTSLLSAHLITIFMYSIKFAFYLKQSCPHNIRIARCTNRRFISIECVIFRECDYALVVVVVVWCKCRKLQYIINVALCLFGHTFSAAMIWFISIVVMCHICIE